MRVVLFRHGPAADRDAVRWPDDGLRPLTHPGEKRTRAAARGLAKLEPGAERIIASPLVRAQQTAALVAAAYGLEAFETSDALSPGATYRRTIGWLESCENEQVVVLVGHEPDLGKLAGTLLFGAPAWIPLKKAGACAIDLAEVPEPGAGRLAWFLQPKHLRRWSTGKEKV